MLISEQKGYNQRNLSASVNIISAFDTYIKAPHRHIQKSYHPSYHCVIYTINGNGRVVHNDGFTVDLEENDVFFGKFSNIRMLECNQGDWHYHIIWFQPSGIDFPLNKKAKVDPEGQEKFMNDILSLINKDSPFCTFQANCKLLNRLSDYLNEFNLQHPAPTFISRIDEIINYIDDNIHTDLKLKDIAKKFNYCEKQLRHIILKKTGLLPKKYIITAKLKQACKLLDSTNYTIEYISFALGFSSVSHFMNTFKKTYNATPIEYRRHSRSV